MITKLRALILLIVLFTGVGASAQAPTFSYTTPQTYAAGNAIPPLSPTVTGVAAPAYSATPATIGSGFFGPTGLTLDRARNLYVADKGATSIKKFPANTNNSVILGSGFSSPDGVVVDAAGNVFVALEGSNSVQELPFVGGSAVPIGSGFNEPTGLTLDASGNLFVADMGNNAIKIVPFDHGVPIVLGSGFAHPTGVAVDAAGNIYVADEGTSQVKKIPVGSNMPIAIGTGFNNPFGVAVDGAGNVFVTDLGNNALKEIVAGTGATITINANLNQPTGVALDNLGNIYVANGGDGTIKEFTPVGGYFLPNALPAGLSINNTTGVISGTPTVVTAANNYTVLAYNTNGSVTTAVNITIAAGAAPTISYSSPQTFMAGIPITPLAPVSSGVAAPGYNGDYVVLSPGLSSVDGIVVDKAGNAYSSAAKSTIIKVPTNGNPGVTYVSGLSNPEGLAIDAADNIYVADLSNKAIEKVPPGGGSFTTAASLNFNPYKVAVDAEGNFYVSFQSTFNGIWSVAEIFSNGDPIVSLASGFSFPNDVVVDASGNVYVNDTGNNTITEIVSGTGKTTAFGTGLIAPATLDIDASNNLYIADKGDNAVKEILATGGSPVTLFTGFEIPENAAVDAAGYLYVVEEITSQFRKYMPTGGYYISPALPAGLSFNNATGVISGAATFAGPAANYTITAYNFGSSTSATISIGISPTIPPSISYTSPDVFGVGVAAPTLAPVSSLVTAPAYKSTRVAIPYTNSATSVATDINGNIYTVSTGSSVVTEIPVGGGTYKTLGSGFNDPQGVAVDAAGNVYVADYGNNAVKKIPVGNGTPVIVAGSLNVGETFSVAVDAVGNVYAGYYGGQVEEFPIAGGTPIIIGSNFQFPKGLAVDAYGNVYVAEATGNKITEIVKATGASVTLGSGFSGPLGVAVDAAGNLFVADGGNNQIKEVAAGNQPPAFIGTFTFNGGGVGGVAVDGAGDVYWNQSTSGVVELSPSGGYHLNVALPPGLTFDTNTGIISGTATAASPATNYMVTAYNPGGHAAARINITTRTIAPAIVSYASPQTYTVNTAITPLVPTSSLVSSLAFSNTTNNSPIAFTSPQALTFDHAGNLYVADGGLVEEFPADGSTPDTLYTSGYAVSIAVDPAGNLFVVDQDTYAAYKIPAGGGTPVKLGGGQPRGIATDLSGNVYYTDNDLNVVWEVFPGGSFKQFATGINNPAGIAVDAAGNVYVSNNSNQVSKIPAGGGTPVVLATGFNFPEGLKVDAAGDVFVADAENNVVKEIPAGSTTVVNIASGFNGPNDVAFDPYGILYVADLGNNLVKTVTPLGGFFINTLLPAGLTFNYSTGTISGTPTAISPATNYLVTGYNAGGGGTPANINIGVTANFDLSGLLISNGTLSPTFTAANTSYSVNVGYNLKTFTVTPTASDLAATITVNGSPVTSGSASPVLPLVVGANVIHIVVTAKDGVSKKTYSLTVNEAHSSNNNLAGLSISTGALSPAFAAATTSYTQTINYSISTLTVTPTSADNTATITVNGAAAASGTASGTLTMFVGVNTISILVTAQNGNTKTYIITVTRQKSTNAALSNITLSKGTLNPAFATATTSYTDVVTNGTTSITLTPIFANAQASATVNGTAIKSGAASEAISLAVGSNNISVVVTAPDGVTTKTYSVNVIRPSTNAKLSALAISAGMLTPTFNTNTISYTASVPNTTTSITVTPTVTAAGAAIQVNGVAVASGTASGALSLALGNNTITIIVTAQDGVTTGKYTLAINRVPSANANLAGLSLSKGTLTPAFAAATTAYTDIVTNGTTSITLTPTAPDATATITVNGTTVVSGKASGAIALNLGNNIVTTIVTAQDGTTKNTYTVNIIRPSTNAKLSALTISEGTLTPVFNTNTTSYTASVAGGVTSITLTPTAAVSGTTIKVNGTAVSSGSASGAIALKAGANTITTVATAQDGVTTDTYTLTVTRAAASTNDNLAGLVVSKGTLSPAFATATTSYTDMVTNGTASVTVTPTVADASATVTVNGTTVVSGRASAAITLVVGLNSVTMIVTAQDGTTKQIYTVNVIRPSTNAKLTLLKISTGALTPAFNTNTISYTDAVTHATSSVTITPTVAVTGATVKVNGTTVISGVASGAITLTAGSNTITTTVTAQDGTTTDTYTITVTRAATGENMLDAAVGVQNFEHLTLLPDDGITVHQGLSPNGDGINDYLQIDNISQYPENKLSIMSRNGILVYEAKGYDNTTKVFDGHSNKNGQLQLPGTYFYSLDYTVKGIVKHKTGFLVLKY